MTITLSTLRDWVELALGDTTNLIWSTETLDQAIRAALAALSGVYGATLTLNGLDSATTTTLEEGDTQALVLGATAYALASRVAERFEEASPVREDIDALVKNRDKTMAQFQDQLEQVRLRKIQGAEDAPYAAWDWEEGEGFA
jgi:hypothetical protein